MNKQDLENLALKLYRHEGWNQMPHIRRVVSQAEDISKRLNKNITIPGYAALYLHDVGRNYPEYKHLNHGVAGSKIVRKLLHGKMSPRAIAIVSNAIAEHDYIKPPRSAVSNLLMSSDANIPDLSWMVRKLYLRTKDMKQYKDLPEDELHLQTAKYLNSHPDDVLTTPPYYEEAYANNIGRLRDMLVNLKPSQVGRLISEADKKYGEDSRQS